MNCTSADQCVCFTVYFLAYLVHAVEWSFHVYTLCIRLVFIIFLSLHYLTGDGPIGLVLAPTRELAQQIHVEAKKFATKVSKLIQLVYFC